MAAPRKPAPKKRRQYRSGSVYKRADGKWVGSFAAGWSASGARRRLTVVADTEAAAKTKLAQRHREFIKNGPPVEGNTGRATVKSWSETWLVIRQKKDRPKTYSSRQSAVNKWIVPTLGTTRLDALTPNHIRRLTDAMLAAGRSSTTARSVQGILTKMLRDALVEGHPVSPRLLEMESPDAAISTREAIPIKDAAALLVTAAKTPDASRWAAALLQGMRQGECLGLTWPCVDLANDVIDVSWQLQPIPYAHGCAPKCGHRFGGDCPDRKRRVPLGYEVRELNPDEALCLVRPKTEKGQRLIPLTPWMANQLQAWQAVAPASPYGLVWPEPNGEPRRAHLDRADWYALQERAGVGRADRPYLLHEARHSAVTLLLELGVDPGVIKAIVGHSNIVTTRGYQTVRMGPVRDALEAAGAALGLQV